jgi:hypothetical protein
VHATIVSIHNHGKAGSEFVLLRANEDFNVEWLILSDSTYTDADHMSNKLRHIFWFPSKNVKKGDYISVHTGKGTNVTTKMDSGTPLHRFYWGLGTPVWNNSGDCAVLFQVNAWRSRQAK